MQTKLRTNLRAAPIAMAITTAGALFTHSAGADSIGFSLAENPSGDIKVVVLDDSTLQPIHDALITLSDLADENSGNLADSGVASTSFSDHEGSANLPLKSPGARALTVLKSGYAALTLVGVRNSKVTVFLKHSPDTIPTVVASGTSTGWRNPDLLLSKPVFAGLVFRTLKPADLLHFGMDLLISPLRDTVDIWGKRKIPSNVVAPEQSIPILFGSVKVNKPDYRLPIPAGQTSRMVLAQGQIDSGDLIALAQGGKAGFDSLNKVQFDRVGVSETLTPTSDFKFNMDASYSLSSTQTVRVNKPPFVSDVVVASVLDLQGDRQYLIPTDLKSPLSSKGRQSDTSISLRSATGISAKRKSVFALAITQDYKRFTGILTDTSEGVTETGEFMNTDALTDSPQAPAQVTLEAPAGGLAQAVFQTSSPEDTKKSYAIWYIFSLPSAGPVTIPTASMPFQQKVTRYATSRMEFSNSFDERSIDGQTLINHVKRFASSLADIKNP